MTRALSRLQDFIRLESSAGIVLMVAAALALIISNSPLSGLYSSFLSLPLAISAGSFAIDKALILWINDGLMAVFFLLVGLEIKREILTGQLSNPKTLALPVLAAIGGMVVPVLIYLSFNIDSDLTRDGWAIPAATDIAFALGLLALLGTRAPVSLKILLLAIAILDDLGAITIIALFYTDNLSLQALSLAGACLVAMLALNRFGIKGLTPYILLTIVMWVCVLKSGVHATLAGVLAAFIIPLKGKQDSDKGPLYHLEHTLHPWVAFMILPIFAFANAGVSLSGLSLETLLTPVTLGIAAGLFLGKQVGVFAFTALAILLKIAPKPEGAGWLHLYGLACLTGVGFTMSLFIGTLAFQDPGYMDQVRLGVLSGSLASALMGVGLLLIASQPKRSESAKEAVSI
ncbi:Na+/H+ antiporter NhaA [Woodsholea maritima]|uniref:Na+/H+ antiporter NhaA n=1 Tax=Woodsholea maritima TaxID=240237 RepID=UPI00036FA7F6|nr:Na+/H+ antiporter NhaA [Woodsholea maritima]